MSESAKYVVMESRPLHDDEHEHRARSLLEPGLVLELELEQALCSVLRFVTHPEAPS